MSSSTLLRRCLLALVASALTSGCANAPPTTRAPDADAIRFEARSSIARAHGIFHDWRIIDAHIDRDDPTASYVEIEIDVSSLDSGFTRRDEHLLDPDFFDVERWPSARARVSHVEAAAQASGKPRYDARFEITLHGTQAEVPGSFRVDSERPLVVSGKLVLDRTAFGVGEPDQWWNPLSPRNEVLVHFRATLDPS